MKMQLKTAVMTLITALFFTACQKEINQTGTGSDEIASASSQAANSNSESNSVGHVYTLSNQTAGNRVISYSRSDDGKLEWEASYASGGNGTGGGLGNQDAVIIASLGDKNFLLAINAGSNSVSSFSINDNGLQLLSTISSGGMKPVSIAEYGEIVFVLNGGGTNNISGLTVDNNGMLHSIANSTRPLSAASTGPAQVSFVNEGNVLVITEKATNKIITYTVDVNGIPGSMHSITSSSATPFGFATGRNGTVFVSEAVGGAPGASVLSSYLIGYNGAITLVDGSVGAGQSAACWVVINNNGKFAYTTNTNNNNISTFGINNSGDISVTQAISATTQAGPIDAALSNNSKYLYVLNGGAHSIQVYAAGNDGSLSMVQTVTGLPAGTNGLAAK